MDPLARRVRETEAHVMLLIERSERDKVATATAHQPLVPACANVQLQEPYSPAVTYPRALSLIHI